MGEKVSIVGQKIYAKRTNSTNMQHKPDSFLSKNSVVENVLAMQRIVGNQAIQRLIKSETLPSNLKIGQPNDRYEQEADRVAEQVMRMPEPKLQKQPIEEEEEIQAKPISDQISPLVQRQPEEEEEEELQTKPAGGQVPYVSPSLQAQIRSLRGGGQPLSRSARNFFEPRFGHDFGQVRVHTDMEAVGSAQTINANAYTIGHDIVFGAGQYSLETVDGKRLLAHELTHVVQQNKDISTSTCKLTHNTNTTPNISSISPGTPLVRKPIKKAKKGKKKKKKVGKICGRPSTKLPDFPKTYISKIDVDLTSPTHNVTLTWNGPNKSSKKAKKGPFKSSPGAGVCGKDCNDIATSKSSGSCCTPKGTRAVEGYSCALRRHPNAKWATYFHASRGIAFHYWKYVPSYPASHGCVRLKKEAAKLIYDNSIKGKTKVIVSGNWKGTRCYPTWKATKLVRRCSKLSNIYKTLLIKSAPKGWYGFEFNHIFNLRPKGCNFSGIQVSKSVTILQDDFGIGLKNIAYGKKIISFTKKKRLKKADFVKIKAGPTGLGAKTIKKWPPILSIQHAYYYRFSPYYTWTKGPSVAIRVTLKGNKKVRKSLKVVSKVGKISKSQKYSGPDITIATKTK